LLSIPNHSFLLSPHRLTLIASLYLPLSSPPYIPQTLLSQPSPLVHQATALSFLNLLIPSIIFTPRSLDPSVPRIFLIGTDRPTQYLEAGLCHLRHFSATPLHYQCSAASLHRGGPFEISRMTARSESCLILNGDAISSEGQPIINQRHRRISVPKWMLCRGSSHISSSRWRSARSSSCS
jgi:hypothetical protein